MSKPGEIFAQNVFNDEVMRERLPKQTYTELRRIIDEGATLEPAMADVVANAMKDWALDKGATHFTHWFQPLTEMSAGKHDAFINTCDGKLILEFSGKELIKGESDASSFPSGGLRVTFEARGYTAWDCTSPAFIKGDTLYIPTAFCSYTGEALDKKTPLLRSMEAINVQSMRVLKLLGNTTATRVVTTCGAEQEYFLVDKDEYLQRKDLMYTGRTLFGARSPKGQELDDHYYGAIKDRVMKYMIELEEELWRLGVSAKTRHNEVAPSQYELAPIFESCNIAADHNQLVMETMKSMAVKHNFVCLLHPKPYKGINGSGKHNNWSLATDDGVNLFKPGKRPEENLEFLVFLSAVIKAVDEYADLLSFSAFKPENDHRLGSNEAPPGIVSIFLGDYLKGIIRNIAKSTVNDVAKFEREELEVGVSTLPTLFKDTTDRNRTSPFAFTGNKFEFRMVASSASISGSTYVLNTIVADALSEIADILEKRDESQSIKDAAYKIVGDIYAKHKRVIFNGNNYGEEWVKEAERRGLPNVHNSVEATEALLKEKNIAVFERHGVFRRNECEARREIALEQYIKTIHIEALATLDIANKEIIPTVAKYQGKLAEAIVNLNNCNKGAMTKTLSSLLDKVTLNLDALYEAVEELQIILSEVECECDYFEKANNYKDKVLPKMNVIREYADNLELIVDEKDWPFPTYTKLLFEAL